MLSNQGLERCHRRKVDVNHKDVRNLTRDDGESIAPGLEVPMLINLRRAPASDWNARKTQGAETACREEMSVTRPPRYQHPLGLDPPTRR